MEVISFVQKENCKRHILRWRITKSNHSWRYESLWRVDKMEPKTSFGGGIWKRQIFSARALLISLLRTHGQSLEDEYLLTLMTEVEDILNFGP